MVEWKRQRGFKDYRKKVKFLAQRITSPTILRDELFDRSCLTSFLEDVKVGQIVYIVLLYVVERAWCYMSHVSGVDMWWRQLVSMSATDFEKGWMTGLLAKELNQKNYERWVRSGGKFSGRMESELRLKPGFKVVNCAALSLSYRQWEKAQRAQVATNLYRLTENQGPLPYVIISFCC